MIKQLSISILFCFFVVSLFSHDYEYKTEIDTLKVYSKKTFVNLKITFNDSILISDEEAFLYPIIQEFPKYRFFPFFFKEKVVMDSVVLHGNTKNWELDGKYRIGKYDNGKKISMKYFDSKGEEISRDKFYEHLQNVRGRCGEEKGTGTIIIR